MNNREYLCEVVISGSPAGITGLRAANMQEVLDDAGKIIMRKAVAVPGIAAVAASAELTALLGTVNVQALQALDTRTTERDAAVLAKQTAEGERDTALARVRQLESQLSAPHRFIKKWQFFTGLRKDGMTEQQITAVKTYIASLPPAVLDLWDGSGGIEEGSPFIPQAQAEFGWTDAQIASMFERYPNITQADVAALAP